MTKNCLINWSDGSQFECTLEPTHIVNLSELSCVVDIKILKN